MGNIDDYSEAALVRSGKSISNYRRVEVNGTIKIEYDSLNRAQGAAVGATAASVGGWCCKLGLVLVSAAVPISTPVVASVLVGTTLGAPVVGAATGAIVGYTNSESHYFDIRTGEFLGDTQNTASEKLNNAGSRFFESGDYTRAAECYNNAYRLCSSNYENEQTFRKNRDKAQAEIDASNLNTDADNSFNQGRYDEARQKYQKAYDKSNVERNYTLYRKNRDKAQVEIDALNLNTDGNNLFSQGRYNEARQKYQEAFDKSSVERNYTLYRNNRDKAQAEIDAINLNTDGNNLFSQGRYSEAKAKYQAALNKSNVEQKCSEYRVNKNKAQAEVDAMRLSSEGNTLFNQGRYNEARQKYQEASARSSISKVKFDACKYKVDGYILWQEGWNVENSDNPDEANHLFEEANNKFVEALRLDPSNQEYVRLKQMVTLKIEGNDLFNQGIELQRNGIQLLQEAQVLQRQRSYNLANVKFNEAKEKFTQAKEKYITGSEHDQRFSSCIEIVQEQLNEVLRSIQITESNTLNSRCSRLNINLTNNNSDANGYESDITDNQDYYEQI